MDANGVMGAVYDPVLRALRVDGDATGGGAVTSVNGETGDVVLDATDVGADPAGSAAAVDTALDDHLADATDAHDASAISVVTSGFTHSSSTNAQSVLADLDGAISGGGGITALTGDVTASGSGSVAATIAAHAVTNAKSAQMAAHTYKGNNTGSTADPIDVTLAQLKTELSLSGTNTGDQTITLTGDVTGTGTGSFAATLATVNSNTGSIGDASHSLTLTLDAKGRTTAASSNSIQIAESQVTNLVTDLAAKAPLASPTFTGTPAAPTATAGTNTTQVATTAFVTTAVAGAGGSTSLATLYAFGG